MVHILGLSQAAPDLKIHILGPDGKPLIAEETPDTPDPKDKVREELELLMRQLEELKAKAPAPGVAKNKVAGKPRAVHYVVLKDKLPNWGKVPQQQADIADILVKHVGVGIPTPESEVFEIVSREAPLYPSLAKSVQHPTYLLKYYRGLKAEGNHAGYIARDFLRVA